MIHSIYPGDLIKISPLENDLKIGQIYLYQSSDKLIIHRLMELNQSQSSIIITKGDNNIIADPPVNRDQILGQVRLLKKSPGHRLFKTWHIFLKTLRQ